jgi:ribA/ribD-fused uncharacterized protein
MLISEFRGEYAFLSNFYNSAFEYDGFEFTTVEHAYQAYKTEDKKMFNLIRLAKTANEAKRMGKRVRLRDDWELIKVGLMENLIWNKFKDKKLRKKLLNTGAAVIQEGNTWGDTFWGVYQGTGENVLGKIIMQVRDKLRTNPDVNNYGAVI